MELYAHFSVLKTQVLVNSFLQECVKIIYIILTTEFQPLNIAFGGIHLAKLLLNCKCHDFEEMQHKVIECFIFSIILGSYFLRKEFN